MLSVVCSSCTDCTVLYSWNAPRQISLVLPLLLFLFVLLSAKIIHRRQGKRPASLMDMGRTKESNMPASTGAKNPRAQ